MEKNKQTWWDKEIKSQFNEFKSWVGSYNAPSKVFIRNLIASRGYKTVIDIGCGMCDDYFAYKNKYPEILWTGVDSSYFLTDQARNKEIPVINREGHDTGLADNGYDVAYSRHVLEHQKSYKPILTEMIRLASKMAVHTFFIPPRDKEIINYTESNNLYHNTYDRNELEEFIKTFDKIKNIAWLPVAPTEESLLISMQE